MKPQADQFAIYGVINGQDEPIQTRKRKVVRIQEYSQTTTLFERRTPITY